MRPWLPTFVIAILTWGAAPTLLAQGLDGRATWAAPTSVVSPLTFTASDALAEALPLRWASEPSHWSFSSLGAHSYLATPLPYMLDADLGASLPASDWAQAHAVTFVPLVATYRFSATDRIAFSLGVSIATSSRQNGARAASTLNVWSIAPKVAFTKVFAGTGVESSTVLAIGTFSRSAVANYQNGAVGRIETLLMQREPGGWSFGGVAAAIEQTNVPNSTLPGHMPNYNSVGGLAIGAGPQLNWSTRWQGSRIELQYRWIYEFRAPNGHYDQPMLLSATLHL